LSAPGDGARCSVVVEALCYKQEGRRFCVSLCHCIFSIYVIVPDRLRGLVVSEFEATEPEVRIRFPALPDFLRSSGSGTGCTQPRKYNYGKPSLIPLQLILTEIYFLNFPIYLQSLTIHSDTFSKWCVGKRGRVEECSVAPLRNKRVKTLCGCLTEI
jgi:hypothetical protein